MDVIRLCAWGYAALLTFVVIVGYVPAFIDQNDMIFGLFKRTWYADGLTVFASFFAFHSSHRRPHASGRPVAYAAATPAGVLAQIV